MKSKIFYLLFVFLSICIFQSIYSQPSQIWQPVRTITHGYIDVNPTFGAKSLSFSMYLTNWEFLAFERHSGTTSKICVIKLDQNGVIDTLTNIISDSYFNRNPALCYDMSYQAISNSLILWESNKNGKWDIYARYYNSSGWGMVFPVDTTSFNKSSPKCIYLNATNFALVYERNNKIVYKELNGQSRVITYDTLLTSGDTSVCRNPNLVFNNSSNKKIVTYERRKADNNFAIYYRTASTLPAWQNPDTVAYIGNNRNSVFITCYSSTGSVYETNRNGKWNIYVTYFPYGGNTSQDTVVKSGFYNINNFNTFLCPVITDAPPSQAYIYVRKSNDSTKIIFGNNISYASFNKDSTAIGDTSKSVKVTLNQGTKYTTGDAIVWAVFNKDSLTYTNLYARKVLILLGEIKRIGNTVPGNYELYQNYPNPFNPNTNIKFSIKNFSFVSIKVYDAPGKEVVTLVNENLKPGTYEVTFNSSYLSSGVYFYKLTAGEFVDVKKMLLIK